MTGTVLAQTPSSPPLPGGCPVLDRSIDLPPGEGATATFSIERRGDPVSDEVCELTYSQGTIDTGQLRCHDLIVHSAQNAGGACFLQFISDGVTYACSYSTRWDKSG